MWPSSSSNKPPSPPSSSPFPFNLPKLPDFPDLPIKLPDDDKKLILSATVLTTSFCTIQLVTQRVLGLVKMHGGRPMLVTTLVGSLLTATNLLLSQQAEKFVQQQTDNYGTLTAKGNSGKFSFGLQGKGAQRKAEMKDNLRRMYLGLGTFLLLEQGAFRTVFPSSILTLGVFANNANMLRRSVVSTSAIATESQRAKIQKLGKRFGCHHCGSRQLFAKEVFIADHMPPTKQANEMAKAWWRRLLKIEVKQRLWPQCFKCFQLQGSAVRSWTHTIVYHNVFKLHYLAPAIALYLSTQKPVQEYVDALVDPTIDFLEYIEKHNNLF